MPCEILIILGIWLFVCVFGIVSPWCPITYHFVFHWPSCIAAYWLIFFLPVVMVDDSPVGFCYNFNLVYALILTFFSFKIVIFHWAGKVSITWVRRQFYWGFDTSLTVVILFWDWIEFILWWFQKQSYFVLIHVSFCVSIISLLVFLSLKGRLLVPLVEFFTLSIQRE